MDKKWKEYENQVFAEFKKRFPDQVIEFDAKMKGRYSRTNRQIDIVIKAQIGDSIQIGVFDCKMFNKKVDVKVVDSMVGFMDDLNANYGGLITCNGFTKAAKNRAESANIKLEIIEFKSPDKLIEHFILSLDFSDPRNSMYLSIF